MNWKLLNRVWHANLGMASAITLGIIALSCPFIAHKSGGGFGRALMEIHYGKFLAPDIRWIWIDGQGFLLAFLIGSGLLMHRKSVKKAANVAADDPAVPGSSVTVLDFGTRGISLATEGERRGLRLFRCPVSGLETLQLAQERWLALLPGDAGFTPPEIEAVQALAAKIKPASIKRLRFAVPTVPGADDMTAALLSTGAQPITLNAEAAFEIAFLDHLCAQSDVLKAAKKASAPGRPPGKPALVANSGFTLLEMLVSIVIVGLLISGAASSLEQMAQADRVTLAARDFQALVQDARDLARRENTWVRVALLPQGKEHAWLNRGDADAPRMGASLRVLRRPALESQAAAMISATTFESDVLQESALSQPVSYPDSLTAAWDFPSGQERWKLWSEQVEMHSPLLKTSVSSSPWLMSASLGEDLPQDLTQTPVKPRQTLKVAPLDLADNVTLSNGQTLSASQVWGTQPVKHWVTQNQSAASLQDVPAFDIDPSGALVGAATSDTLVFTFQNVGPETSKSRQVFIQTSTGESWIE